MNVNGLYRKATLRLVIHPVDLVDSGLVHVHVYNCTMFVYNLSTVCLQLYHVCIQFVYSLSTIVPMFVGKHMQGVNIV